LAANLTKRKGKRENRGKRAFLNQFFNHIWQADNPVDIPKKKRLLPCEHQHFGSQKHQIALARKMATAPLIPLVTTCRQAGMTEASA